MYFHRAAAPQSALSVSSSTVRWKVIVPCEIPTSGERPVNVAAAVPTSLTNAARRGETKALDARPTTTRRLITAFSRRESRLASGAIRCSKPGVPCTVEFGNYTSLADYGFAVATLLSPRLDLHEASSRDATSLGPGPGVPFKIWYIGKTEND